MSYAHSLVFVISGVKLRTVNLANGKYWKFPEIFRKFP